MLVPLVMTADLPKYGGPGIPKSIYIWSPIPLYPEAETTFVEIETWEFI